MEAWLHREREAKIEIISSIAKSQDALARMLANIAQITDHSNEAARTLAENVRVLSGYQCVMAEMLTGIHFNRVKTGSPASPWLKAECSAAGASSAGAGGRGISQVQK